MPKKLLPPLVVYPSRVKTLVLVAVCALLLTVSLVAVMFFQAQIEQTKLYSGRLYAGIWLLLGLFFVGGGLGLAWNCRQLLFPRSVVAISSEGIEALWFGLLPWEEIDHLAKVKQKGQWLLGIFPKDPEEVLARQGRLQRALSRQAIQQGLPAFYLTQLALPMTIEQLLVQIRRYADVPIVGLDS